MNGEPEPPRAPSLSLADILRIAGAAPPGASTVPPSAPASEPAPVDPIDVAQFLGQAWVAYMASGLRYWSRVADAWVRAMPPIARAVAESVGAQAPDPEGRAKLLDELRARLREIAESPAEEARVLQAELERVAASVWPAPPPEPGQEGQYWRRWDAKA